MIFHTIHICCERQTCADLRVFWILLPNTDNNRDCLNFQWFAGSYTGQVSWMTSALALNSVKDVYTSRTLQLSVGNSSEPLAAAFVETLKRTVTPFPAAQLSDHIVGGYWPSKQLTELEESSSQPTSGSVNVQLVANRGSKVYGGDCARLDLEYTQNLIAPAGEMSTELVRYPLLHCHQCCRFSRNIAEVTPKNFHLYYQTIIYRFKLLKKTSSILKKTSLIATSVSLCLEPNIDPSR